MSIVPPRPSSLTLDAFLDQIEALSYRQRRLYLTKRQPSYPRFIYKYKAPPKEATPSVQHLRDLLVDGRFWLSSPRDFNDPFDMTGRVTVGAKGVKLRDRVHKLVKTHRSGLGWKKRERMERQLLNRTPAEMEAHVQQAHETNMSAVGVFSFAGDPKSILMWSHYGLNHEGVCLQFETARDPRTLLGAIGVTYVRDYPVVTWTDDSTEQVKKTLLHKFEAWGYERERRIIWPNGARKYLPFDPAALTGVVLGLRASDATITLVQTILAGRVARGLPSVRLYRAEKHGSKYALVIRRTV